MGSARCAPATILTALARQDLPRIEQSFIATGIGLKANYFGDVLHHLRSRAGYEQIVQRYNIVMP